MKRIILLLLILTAAAWLAAQDCTTVGSVGKASVGGVTILGKNRDYPVDAGQILLFQTDADHPKEEQINMQAIAVPQAGHTYQFLSFKALDERGKGRKLYRWGAGMGMNQFRVSVANNDAPTWDRYDQPALHDNDVTRLILERCRTAREAVDLVDQLVAKYHLGVPEIFLVADSREAWIIETTGNHWAAQHVVDGVFARANRFEITDPDLPDDSGKFIESRSQLIEFARTNNRYCEEDGRFSFRLSYSDDYASAQNTHYNETRFRRASQLMEQLRGKVTPEAVSGVLRDHYEGFVFKTADGKAVAMQCAKGDPHSAVEGKLLEKKATRTICYGGSVGSMVCVANPAVPDEMGVMWATLNIPCLSVYVPYFPAIHNELDPALKTALDQYEPNSAWWQFQELWRALSPKWDQSAKTVRTVRQKFASLEQKERKEWSRLSPKVHKLLVASKRSDAERLLQRFSAHSFRESLKVVKQLQRLAGGIKADADPPAPFKVSKY